MSVDLKAQLKAEENGIPYMYFDSLGMATIAYGRLIDKRKGGHLSDDEMELLLDHDIAEKTAEVMHALPWAATLNEARQAVLIGMAFQMGTAGLLTFKFTLANVRGGFYELAAAAMVQSKWAAQTPARAQRLARQMTTGEFQMPGVQ